VLLFIYLQTAKNYAALRALHVFCQNTNIASLFPPEYRDYWKKLSSQKEEREKEMKREREEKAKVREEMRKEVCPTVCRSLVFILFSLFNSLPHTLLPLFSLLIIMIT
jgi:hypothetical protein